VSRKTRDTREPRHSPVNDEEMEVISVHGGREPFVSASITAPATWSR
jgi:hypothetical protein